MQLLPIHACFTNAVSTASISTPTPGKQTAARDRQRPRDLNLEMDIGSATGTRPLCVSKYHLESLRCRHARLIISQGWQTTNLRARSETPIEHLDAGLARRQNQLTSMVSRAGSEIDVIQFLNDWARFGRRPYASRSKTSVDKLRHHPSLNCSRAPNATLRSSISRLFSGNAK